VRWSSVYALATWALIVFFVFLTGAHLVLTTLFYTGVRDTGVGYVLAWEWPAWLITIMDGLAAWLLWLGYRQGPDAPVKGLVRTSTASLIMLARAVWFVIVPIFVVLTMAGAIGRVRSSRRTDMT